ncbi:MAG: hypothetical protein QME51_06260, partial [Planctomycetota bacterium]|nr:hypothetical protein [Planctomycetota bacterium]
MKIYMHHSENSAVGYYRIWQPAKWLNKLGLAEARTIPAENIMIPINKKDRDEKIGSMEEMIEWADLMIFQRRETYSQYALIQCIYETYKKPIVLEIDDNLIDIDRSHPQYEVHREKAFNEAFEVRRVKTSEMELLRRRLPIVKVGYHYPPDGMVDIVIRKNYDCGWLNRYALAKIPAITTTTDELKKVYQRFNSNVYVLPNCIDFELWDAIPEHIENKRLRIGWAGGWQHIKDINSISNVLETILKKYPEVEFHFVRCKTDEMERLLKKYPDQIKYIGEGCKIQDWVETFSSWGFDIGLAPLWTNTFNKGKCITGDSLVITPKGIKTIKSIYEKKDDKIALFDNDQIVT